MIYTMGCSFTKWVWHTWSDWLEEYSNQPVINLGWPGISNEVIFWELLNRRSQITSNDRVIVMLTGNNRVSTWYDKEWIDNNDCLDFFPKCNKKLEFGQEPYRGLYRVHPDYMPSLTHMIIDNFNIIYQIQNLLNSIGCEYQMVFWQNPWYDIRPIRLPKWEAVWVYKSSLSATEKNIAKSILKINPVQELITIIDWNRFYLPPADPLNPESYQGMWEYKNTKQSDKQYIQYAHGTDLHPDALIQHDFLVDVILGQKIEDTPTRQLAKDCALSCVNTEVQFDYNQLICLDLTTKIKRIYT